MTTQNSINNASPNIAAHSLMLSQGTSAQTGLLLTTGQVAVGVTGSDPVGTTLPVPVTFVNQTSSSVTVSGNTAYLTNNGASLVTYTLPATMSLGAVVQIRGASAGGWIIAQATGQAIHFLSSTTTTGTGGSLASSNQYDSITISCIVANTTFTVDSASGNITVV